MQRIGRAGRRTRSPDLFVSHSSQDKVAVRKLALHLTLIGVDAWLDEWEAHVGQSLSDSIAEAMSESRYIAIVMTQNYNTTAWTKTEYRRALSRERAEDRVVMLPILLSGTVVPEFLDDKIRVDLREQYYVGLAQVAGLVHEIPEFRLNRALAELQPDSILGVWDVLEYAGFEPFIVVEDSDFEEMLGVGGTLKGDRDDYAEFEPEEIFYNPRASRHIKSILKEMFPYLG